jgi:hypothetical protein
MKSGRNKKAGCNKKRAAIKSEPMGHHFFVNVALTGTEYPLFFAPEVVH